MKTANEWARQFFDANERTGPNYAGEPGTTMKDDAGGEGE